MLNGWRTLLASAKPAYERLNRALHQPANAQAKLLEKIIDQNADTDFGQRHGFSAIRTPTDFQRAVPVSTYEDYRDPILAIADGTVNRLTAEDVIAFEHTGGTSSGSKLIPYTASSFQSFQSAVLPWLFDLAMTQPKVAEGRCYVSISPATRKRQTTPSGIPIGLPSEAAYLGPHLIDAFTSILDVPPDVVALEDVCEWRLATLASLVACQDLRLVSVWSPTFFTSLLRGLEDEALQRRLGAQDRKRLELALASDRPPSLMIWPHLSVVSCWADGSSRALANELAVLCPHAAIQPKGLLATEGAVTIPFGSGVGAIPAVTSSFLEFVDSTDTIHLAHELAPDETYRVLMTTSGGLYRYDLGDLVRCVSVEKQIPRLVFEGRTGLRSDLVGEKLEEAFVAKVLANITVPATLVARTGPQPHYELWLDGPVNMERLKTLENEVEHKLSDNPQYAYARNIGQLPGVQAIVKPGFIARLQAEKVASGARLGDLKHTALMPAGTID